MKMPAKKQTKQNEHRQPEVDSFLPLCAKGCSLLSALGLLYSRHFGRRRTETKTPCHSPRKGFQWQLQKSYTRDNQGDVGDAWRLGERQWLTLNSRVHRKIIVRLHNLLKGRFGGVEQICGKMTFPEPPLGCAIRKGPSKWGERWRNRLWYRGVL